MRRQEMTRRLSLRSTAIALLASLGCSVATVHAQQAEAQQAEAPQPAVSEEVSGEYESEPSPSDQHADSPLESRVHSGLLIGGKVGGGLGKPFSEFGATPVFELELGYLLPPLHRSIELFVSGQYTQPGIDGISGKADPRLPGATSFDLTQQELALSFGGLYRFDVGSRLLMPYAGLGARLYLLNTKVKGSAGDHVYGQNEETHSAAGLLLLGGLELFVGPGALLGELSFGWAAVDGFVLRDTNLGALHLAFGYRLML
jgi:hypothetical protein